jgi:lipid-A-disaccharide synthase-like uncharacterized protein
MDITFKILGALGLIFITLGVLSKNRIRQNILFIIGGLLLEAYSIYLRDPIFIPLQAIFTLAALYEMYKLKK